MATKECTTRRATAGSTKIVLKRLEGYERVVVALIAKATQGREKFGRDFCNQEFGDDRELARNYDENPYYIKMRVKCGTGELPASQQWLQDTIHVAILDLILEDLNDVDNFRALSFSHRRLFVKFGFVKYDYIRTTLGTAREEGWTVRQLQSRIRFYNIKEGKTKDSARNVATTYKKALQSMQGITKIRTASKLSHRDVSRGFDTEKELEEALALTCSQKKELTSYETHLEKELQKRSKKR